MAFAERLAHDCYDIIVVARRMGRLATLTKSLPKLATEVVAANLSTD